MAELTELQKKVNELEDYCKSKGFPILIITMSNGIAMQSYGRLRGERNEVFAMCVAVAHDEPMFAETFAVTLQNLQNIKNINPANKIHKP